MGAIIVHMEDVDRYRVAPGGGSGDVAKCRPCVNCFRSQTRPWTSGLRDDACVFRGMLEQAELATQARSCALLRSRHPKARNRQRCSDAEMQRSSEAALGGQWSLRHDGAEQPSCDAGCIEGIEDMAGGLWASTSRLAAAVRAQRRRLDAARRSGYDQLGSRWH